MHREVPPLHVPGCLFSVSYVYARSIDRSAPRGAARAKRRRTCGARDIVSSGRCTRRKARGQRRTLRAGEASVPARRGADGARAETLIGVSVFRGIKTPRCHSVSDTLHPPAAAGGVGDELFICTHDHRSTLADFGVQVSTGRKYSASAPVLSPESRGSSRRAQSC
jgi:hypothetical protein